MARILLVRALEASLDTGSYCPPVGVLYVAAALRRAGHDVALFDDWRPRDAAARLQARVRAFRPDAVGFSALTSAAPLLHRLARAVKDVAATIPVFAGGAYPTAATELCLRDPAVDVVVRHEGDVVAPRLVAAFEAGAPLDGVAGIARRDARGGVQETAPAGWVEDLDTLPWPAWDLVDLPFYWRRRALSPVPSARWMPLVTSRGCPFHCLYCHQHLGKGYRARSVDGVLAEVDDLVARYRPAVLEILDDMFNHDRERTAAILDALAARRARHPLRLRFPVGLRVDALDEDLIDRFRAAGADYLSVAIESGSPRMQKVIRKGVDLERAQRMIRHAARRGMLVAGFFLVGLPGETEADLAATFDFALRSDLHAAMMFLTVPFLGTELHARYGRPPASPDGLADQLFNRGAYNLSDVSDARLHSLRRRALLRFYGSPRRLARLVRVFPGRRQLPRWLPFLLRNVFPRGATAARSGVG